VNEIKKLISHFADLQPHLTKVAPLESPVKPGTPIPGSPELGAVATCDVLISNSQELNSLLDEMFADSGGSSIPKTTWPQQFIDAVTPNLQNEGVIQLFHQQEKFTKKYIGGKHKIKMCKNIIMYVLTLPWRVAFAFLPPSGALRN
jgi:hypothetical protein